MITKPEMFAAFLAGFNASAEGFNGEYVSDRYLDPTVLEAELHKKFEGWMRGRGVRVL